MLSLKIESRSGHAPGDCLIGSVNTKVGLSVFFLKVTCPQCGTTSRSPLPATGDGMSCLACHAELSFPWPAGAETTWHVQRGKEAWGPFSFPQLKDLADSGQLVGQDIIIKRGESEGRTARSLPCLFAALPDQSEPMLVGHDAGPSSGKSRVALPSKQTPAHGNKRPPLSLSLNDFQIIRKLGAGGMGTVFLARQTSRNRLVALKVLSETLARKQDFVARFHREEKVLASLQHANVVSFFGAGQDDDLPFFAMEYIEGFSARLLLNQLTRFRVEDALHIVIRCAEALRFAHERHIVHRDIKPENIMITRLGHVKMTDMGLAKPLREELGLTDSGTSIGTPRYMAPEQARNGKNADHRSDIYALGGVLYHFLTGQPPFSGATTMDLMLAKEQGMFSSARSLNPDVPPRLDLVLDKMLARNPRHRYQSCELLIADLERLGLTNEHLMLNPLHVAAAASDTVPEVAQVLLIDNDIKHVLMVQQTLEDNNVPSNLHIVHDGREALAFLRGEDSHSFAPRPSLIVLGRDIHDSGSLEVLELIREHAEVAQIPTIVLAIADDTLSFLEERGYRAALVVSKPGDQEQFDQLLQSVQGLCLTVVERR